MREASFAGKLTPCGGSLSTIVYSFVRVRCRANRHQKRARHAGYPQTLDEWGADVIRQFGGRGKKSNEPKRGARASRSRTRESRGRQRAPKRYPFAYAIGGQDARPPLHARTPRFMRFTTLPHNRLRTTVCQRARECVRILASNPRRQRWPSRVKSLRPFFCALALIGCAPSPGAAQNTRPKTTYLWHLHQPLQREGSL